MTCATCGNPNAVETCFRCETWICEECAQDHEGYILCQICYGEMTGESFDESFDDDLELEDEETKEDEDLADDGDDGDGDEDEDDEDYL